MPADPNTTTAAHATITACWDALGQARTFIAGPNEPTWDGEKAVLEMIDEAIEDCRRTISNGI